MKLYEFVRMAVDNYYDCHVWDNNKEDIIFKGKLHEVPDELLEREITSWEISENEIGFNID